MFAQVNVFEQSNYLDSVLEQLLLDDDKNRELLIQVIDRQIDLKNEVNSQLKNQIVQIDKDIFNHELYYERLNSQLSYEKDLYSDLVVKAYRIKTMLRQNFDIFSFDNLYKTYKQFLYVKWLSDYRVKKIKRINELKSQIEKLVISLNQAKEKRSKIAAQMGVEQEFINKYQTKRNNLISLYANKSKSEESKTSYSFSDSLLVQNNYTQEEIDELSAMFQIQKGYMIWPVKKSVIISSFGTHPHPLYEKVMIKNDGVDFCVPANSEVRSVYNGVVNSVINLPQKKFAIIVRHGQYFTVYSGLDHIKIERGQQVEKDQIIGNFDSKEKFSILNFQIWNKQEKLNPQSWLVKYKK